MLVEMAVAISQKIAVAMSVNNVYSNMAQFCVQVRLWFWGASSVGGVDR